MQEIGEPGDDGLQLIAGRRVARNKNDPLACQHHSRRTGDFAVDEEGALLRQWLNLLRFEGSGYEPSSTTI